MTEVPKWSSPVKNQTFNQIYTSNSSITQVIYGFQDNYGKQ